MVSLCALFSLLGVSQGPAEMADIPDPKGVAGAYAGVTDKGLIVAGGANFPDRPPWEGGKKVWHDGVFLFETKSRKWIRVGVLPRPLGYGVSVGTPGGLICIGGSSSTESHHAECFRLTVRDGKVQTTQLPKLPEQVAECAGVVRGSRVYVVGGRTSGTAVPDRCRVWSRDISDDRSDWMEEPPIPGPGRILAVAAVVNDELFIFGGCALQKDREGAIQRKYLVDGYRLGTDRRRHAVADLPRAVTAAPSPAPVVDGRIHIIGGDDGTQVGRDPKTHRGFSAEVLVYDPGTGKWSTGPKIADPRVTAPLVRWGDSWWIVSGEIRPGVRSPGVVRYAPR